MCFLNMKTLSRVTSVRKPCIEILGKEIQSLVSAENFPFFLDDILKRTSKA